MLAFLERLRQRAEQAVLVVAHEETLRVCVAYFRGLSDEDMLSVKIDNCELLAFDLSNPGL